MTTTLIIDGNNLFYRAMFSPMKPLRSPKGKNTTGIYVFFRTITAMMRESQADHLLMTMDPPTHTLKRTEAFPEYKGNRRRGDDEDDEHDFRFQIRTTRRILNDLGFPPIESRGHEADDVMGTLAHHLPDDHTGIIVTRDHDLGQVLREDRDVYINDPFDGRNMGYAQFHEKTGLWPEEYPFYLCLKGDPGDNIPGVAGIGEVMAKKIIREMGIDSIDVLRDSLHRFTPAKRAKIEATDLDLMMMLVTIDTNVKLPAPMDFLLHEGRTKGFSLKRAAERFGKLGIRQWT